MKERQIPSTDDYLNDAILTAHARDQMSRRGISEAQVREVLQRREEILTIRGGRVVIQGIVDMGNPPASYYLRVFVDTDRTPAEVVTAYRTSKIAKYRSRS